MTLHIPVEIWRRMQCYTELSAPNEVTGIGTVEILDPEQFLVKEIFLPRQTTSPGVCEFQEGELNWLIADLMERDPDQVEKLRFRWHSHGLSHVFWSSIDERDIDSWEAPWVLNLVMNAHGKSLLRFDAFSSVLRIRNHPVELKIDYSDDAVLCAECTKELEEKLTVQPLISRLGKELKDGLLGPKQDFRHKDLELAGALNWRRRHQ